MQIAERSRSAMRNVLVAGIAAWTLAGCAGFSQDGGFGTVEEAARQHLGRTVIRGNSEAARGRIVDADFAVETANLARAQILQQAGTAMVAQANSMPQQVLSLLQIGRAHV